MTKHDNVSQEGIIKATEFVKEHGWSEVKRIVACYPDHTHVTDDARMFINKNTCADNIRSQLNEVIQICELKRLVESHELVEFFGSLDDAIQIYEYSKDMEILSYGGREIPTKQLGQAIADVEACQ